MDNDLLVNVFVLASTRNGVGGTTKDYVEVEEKAFDPRLLKTSWNNLEKLVI